MSRRNKNFETQGERWQRPIERKPYISPDEIIRRAVAQSRGNPEAIAIEMNTNRRNKNPEMIARLVAGIKNLNARDTQTYNHEGWY